MCNEIVGVNGDEGTPVPIPNTVVKLVYGDNTWLATAREDNSTPTSKAATKVAAFSFFCRNFTGYLNRAGGSPYPGGEFFAEPWRGVALCGAQETAASAAGTPTVSLPL